MWTSKPPPRWKLWLLACSLLGLGSLGLWSATRATEVGSSEAAPAMSAKAPTDPSASVKAPEFTHAPPSGLPPEVAEARDHGGSLVLSGHVVNEQGQPLEGVRVLLLPQALSALEFSVETTTDGEGHYRLATLPPGLYDVLFTARRYLSHRFTGHALSTSGTLDAMLEPAPLVEGRVVNEQGQPVPGAQVKLAFPPDQGDWDDFGEYEKFGTVSWEQTGEGGRFALDASGPGPWSLSAAHPAYLGVYKAKVPAPLSGLELVLPTGASLEVEVVDEQGRPVPDAECQLSLDDEWISGEDKRWTDEHGRALYEAVHEGRYALSASSPRSQSLRLAAQKLELRGRERRQVRLQLPAGWALQGVVVDTQGRPVAGALVRAAPDSIMQPKAWKKINDWPRSNYYRRFREEWSGEAGGEVSTDPEGRFELKHLLPEAYRLTAARPGYTLDAEATGSAVEVDGQETGLRVPVRGGPVRLVLRWQGLIRGRVVQQGAGPLSSFFLNSHKWQSEDGTFVVPLDGQGSRVLLMFEAPGLAPTWREVEVSLGQEVDMGDVVLEAGRPVRVRVVDAEAGSPVERAVVSLHGEGNGESDRAGVWGVTDREGLLVLEAVERRPMTMVVRGTEHLVTRVTLAADQEEVTVTLRAGATLQGGIRTAQGPVPYGHVSLYDETGQWRYKLEVREGWYSRQGVAAGLYVARVSSAWDEAASFPWQEVRVPEAGTVQLDFVARTEGGVLTVEHPEEVEEIRLVPGRQPLPRSLAALRLFVLRSHPYNEGWSHPRSFRFSALPAGPYTLLAWRLHRDQLQVYRHEVEVPAGASRVLELRPQWQPFPEPINSSRNLWNMP